MILGGIIFPVNHCSATENKIHNALQFQGAYGEKESEFSVKEKKKEGREAGRKEGRREKREDS